MVNQTLAMTQKQIDPNKVTRPFQLLAAWLVTLIAVDAAFLAGARLISQPSWVGGLLVIAAVMNVPVFIISMFLLQTRFRPEMQDDKYYATYLKSRQETKQLAGQLNERLAKFGADIQTLVSAQQKPNDLPAETKEEIKSLLQNLRNHVDSPQPFPRKEEEMETTAVLALAKGYFVERNWAEAAAAFGRYSRDYPEDWQASYACGVAFANCRGGNITDMAALLAYSRAITYAPTDDTSGARARLFSYRGAMLKRLLRLDEAEADLNLALRFAPQEYERLDAIYNLACVYALQHRREEMLKMLKQAVQSPSCLGMVRKHVNDYFATYRNDAEFRRLTQTS